MRRVIQTSVVVAWITAAPAWPHVRASEGFHINLPVPFERLRDVTHEVCTDGVIHGTFQYEHDTIISGATTAAESTAFPAWQGRGEVCFKVREHAVAPANFVATNDVGAITVRYLVEPVSPQETHISIDAVFIEDGRNRRHLSTGLVETSEFREIATELKAISNAERAKVDAVRAREEQQRKAQEDAAEKQRQQTLAAEMARLKTAEAAMADLETQAQALRRQLMVRARSSGALLLAAPFSHANVIKVLASGQTAKILMRTRYWDRVRCLDSAEGWVYHLLMEPSPVVADKTQESYDASSLTEVRARRESLEFSISELKDELARWKPEAFAPVALGAVTKAVAPIRTRPLATARVLFRGGLQDEFEVLEDRGAWIQVRAAGQNGWMRRGDLDLSAGMAVDNGAGPQISREEVEEFSGDWSELQGKQAAFLWIRDAGDKWAAAKRLFADRYLALMHAPRGGQPIPAGVVLVFNSAEPAVAAAGITQIESWVEGEISEAAFLKRCSLDPGSAFHP